MRVAAIASLACAVVAGSALVGVGTSAAATGAGTQAITTVVGGGSTTAITNGISSVAASLGSPLAAIFDAHGNIVFADQNNNVIRVAAAATGTFYGRAMTAGHLYTIIGNGVAGDLGDGTVPSANKVELSDPNGVAIDAQGDMAITDSGNDAVRFVTATGGLRYGQEMTAGQIYTIAGGGEEGDITPGGSVFSAGLTSPDGVAFDAQGDVIVADTGNDVIRLIPAVARTIFGQAVQPGRIYTIAGDMNYGYTGNNGPALFAQLQLDSFNGLAVNAKGDVIFSDVDNQVVRLIPAVTGTYLGKAVKADYIYTIVGTSAEGLKGDKKPATKAWLDTPQGVAVDSAGNLFISDSANNMIRFVPAAKGTYDGMAVKAGDIYTIAGKGAAGYSGNGGLATQADLNDPAGVSVGPSGRILIVDNGNNVIREMSGTAPAAPLVTAIKPSSGPTSGDRKVTILGANLTSTSAVMFGSRPAVRFVVKSDKKVLAYTPVGSVGRVSISVYSPTGVSVTSGANSYTYLPASAVKKNHRR